MSKRDRRNRGSWNSGPHNNSQQADQDGEFDDLMDEFSSSVDAMNKDFEKNLQSASNRIEASSVIASEDIEDEEEDGVSWLSAAFGKWAGALGEAGRFLYAKSCWAANGALSGTLFLCRKALLPAKKLWSLVSTRPSDEDDSDEAEIEQSPTASATSTRQEVDAASMLADYDDDEAALFSSWKKWTLLSGTAAAVLLVAFGGYWSFNAFFVQGDTEAIVDGNTEIAHTETANHLPDDSPPSSLPVTTEVKPLDSVAAPTQAAPAKEETPAQTLAAEIQPTIGSSIPPLRELTQNGSNGNEIEGAITEKENARQVAGKDKATDNTVPEPKIVEESRNDSVAKMNEKPAIPPMAASPRKTTDPFATPPMLGNSEAKQPGKVASNDPWAANAASTEPASTSDPFGSGTKEEEAGTPTALAANPWAINEIPATLSPVLPKQEPVRNKGPIGTLALERADDLTAEQAVEPAMPLPDTLAKTPASSPVNTASTAPTLPAFSSNDSTSNETPLTPLAQPSDLNLMPLVKTAKAIDEPSPSIPVVGEAASKSRTPEPATAVAQPLIASAAPTTPAGLTIPDTSKSDAAFGLAPFGHAPTPPAIDAAPPMDTSLMSPRHEEPKEEVTPSIAHSGEVKALAGMGASLIESKPVEPVPALPAELESRSMAFVNPASNVPPSPRRTITATPGTFASEAALVIPTEQAVNYAVDQAGNQTGAGTATMPLTPVTPLLPQHAELAKSEPPLGSGLQNHLQNRTGMQSETPRIRFTPSGVAGGGAVAFRPSGARHEERSKQPDLLTMPADGNEATALSALLPTGQAATSEPPGSLPSLEAAPQSVMASSGPGYGYGHVGSRLERRPAMAGPNNVHLPSSDNRERRAVSFQQRINDEIKQSPSETEQYVVQDGDTYMTICDRFFGTSLLFRALAEHNRKRFGAAYMPEPGTVIEIPPADYLQTNYGESMERGRRRLETRNAARGGNDLTSTSLRSRSGIRYVARQGDTVFSIATDQLKDTSLWRNILAMNDDKVHDPRSPIPAGTEILIPANMTAQTGVVRQ